MADGPYIIEIRDFTYRYPPAEPGGAPVTALDGITLDIAAGECLGVTGTAGSGKSTLCLALNGLVPHATGGTVRGEVRVGGWSTKELPVPRLATRVGMVFQDPESNLVGLTVEDEVAFGPENLGVPREEIAARVAWALEAVGMASARRRPAAQLSGGQKQRVAIAAVLAMRPQVLVLDEPTAQLDPTGKEEVAAAIAALRRERGADLTVVLVEQDAELLARLADRVVVLDAGRIVLSGTTREIFTRVDHLAALGVFAPQVAEVTARLSAALGADLAALTPEEAAPALRARLRKPGHPERSQERAEPFVGDNPVPGDESLNAADRRGAAGEPVLTASEHDAAAPEPLVVVEGVHYRYGGSVPALRGVDLTLAPGEFVALLGVNGSGKTTLAKHLNGLLRPDAGRVLVAGRDTRQHPPGELARVVGYVFQNPDHQIFQPTVAAEVASGPRNLGARGADLAERVDEALARFGLTDLRDRHPMLLGRAARRRVALAAVYATRPRLLVLDEPTGGLDRRDTAELMATLEALVAEGTTVLLITHDLRLAATHARRVVVMWDGRVVADGPPEAILADAERLAAAGLRPAPVTRLSLDLADTGMLPALTVESFCEAFLRRASGGAACPAGGRTGEGREP